MNTNTPTSAPYEQEFFDFLIKNRILDEFIEKTISYHDKFILDEQGPQFYISGAFVWAEENEKWIAISRRWNEKLDDIQQQERIRLND